MYLSGITLVSLNDSRLRSGLFKLLELQTNRFIGERSHFNGAF